MKAFWYTAMIETNVDEMARVVVHSVPDDELIEFVLKVDEVVADLDFTKELHRRLGEAIALEETEEKTA